MIYHDLVIINQWSTTDNTAMSIKRYPIPVNRDRKGFLQNQVVFMVF
jgi:hypothetical protein